MESQEAAALKVKVCKGCRLVKPVTEFHRCEKWRTVGHLSGKCKSCVRSDAAEFRRRFPEKVKAWSEKYRLKRRVEKPEVVARHCDQCRALITPRPNNAATQRFCSRRCSVRARTRTRRKLSRIELDRRNQLKRTTRAARRLAPKVCEFCSEIFTPLRRADQRFCSGKCQDKRSKLSRSKSDYWRNYFREYSRQRRRLGLAKQRSPEDAARYRERYRERNISRLRAYYHSHKEDYRKRKQAWSAKPENKTRILDRQFNRRWRSASERELSIRRTLRDLKRWCRANGFHGYRQFLQGLARES